MSPQTRLQLEEVRDSAEIVRKGLYECKPENFRDVVGIFRNLPPSLLDRLIDPVSCAKLFGIVIQSQTTLDAEGHLDALVAIHRVYERPKGKQQVMLNTYIMEYLRKALSSEFVALANQAAGTVASMLRDGIELRNTQVSRRYQRQGHAGFLAAHRVLLEGWSGRTVQRDSGGTEEERYGVARKSGSGTVQRIREHSGARD